MGELDEAEVEESSAYIDTVGRQISAMKEGNRRMFSLLDKPVLGDPGWESAVKAAAESLSQLSHEALGITPPERFRPFHEGWVGVLRLFACAAGDVVTSIELHDKDSLTRATEKQEQVPALIEKIEPLLRLGLS